MVVNTTVTSREDRFAVRLLELSLQDIITSESLSLVPGESILILDSIVESGG